MAAVKATTPPAKTRLAFRKRPVQEIAESPEAACNSNSCKPRPRTLGHPTNIQKSTPGPVVLLSDEEEDMPVSQASSVKVRKPSKRGIVQAPSMNKRAASEKIAADVERLLKARKANVRKVAAAPIAPESEEEDSDEDEGNDSEESDDEDVARQPSSAAARLAMIKEAMAEDDKKAADASDDEEDQQWLVDMGFSPGVTVELQGLQGAPELNGKTGKLVQFVKETMRWQVEVADGVGVKNFKLANLVVQETHGDAAGVQGEDDGHWEDEGGEEEEKEIDECVDTETAAGNSESKHEADGNDAEKARDCQEGTKSAMPVADNQEAEKDEETNTSGAQDEQQASTAEKEVCESSAADPEAKRPRVE